MRRMKSFLNIKAWRHVPVETQHTDMNLNISIMGPFKLNGVNKRRGLDYSLNERWRYKWKLTCYAVHLHIHPCAFAPISMHVFVLQCVWKRERGSCVPVVRVCVGRIWPVCKNTLQGNLPAALQRGHQSCVDGWPWATSSPVALSVCGMEVNNSDCIHIFLLLLTVSLSLSSSQVLSVLCVLSTTTELPWSDGVKMLSQEELLLHLLALAQNSTHRSEKTHIHVRVQIILMFPLFGPKH